MDHGREAGVSERKDYLTKSIARLFVLVRDQDESGVSGVGVYPCLKELERIHGHGGKTNVEFLA